VLESKEKKELQLLILSLYSLTSLIYLGEEGNRRQVEGKLSPEGVDYVIRDTLKYLATKLFASFFPQKTNDVWRRVLSESLSPSFLVLPFLF
jgi:hypothetical protein